MDTTSLTAVKEVSTRLEMDRVLSRTTIEFDAEQISIYYSHLEQYQPLVFNISVYA